MTFKKIKPENWEEDKKEESRENVSTETDKQTSFDIFSWGSFTITI